MADLLPRSQADDDYKAVVARSENQIYIHELSNTGLCEFELTDDMIEKIKNIGVVYVWMHGENDALLLNISIK